MPPLGRLFPVFSPWSRRRRPSVPIGLRIGDKVEVVRLRVGQGRAITNIFCFRGVGGSAQGCPEKSAESGIA